MSSCSFRFRNDALESWVKLTFVWGLFLDRPSTSRKAGKGKPRAPAVKVVAKVLTTKITLTQEEIDVSFFFARASFVPSFFSVGLD